MLAALATKSALAGTNGDSSNSEGRKVRFRDGTTVPAIGQGSWHLAQGRHPEAVEEDALRIGLSLGMRLIDTAELYGEGRAESLISHVIAGQRERVFLVSKVLPSRTSEDGIARACASSLARLGTDYLDLYLLHWRDADTNLSRVVAEFENLRAKGKIRTWVCRTSKLAIWKICFVFRTAIAARPIKFVTISIAAALNMICYLGANNTTCL